MSLKVYMVSIDGGVHRKLCEMIITVDLIIKVLANRDRDYHS